MSARGWCYIGIAVLGLTQGCRFEPTGASSWEPPPSYKVWWDRTRTCSGLSRDFDEIKWFVVEGKEFDCPSGKCVGRWETNNHVYLASEFANHEMVVSHEMLHALIGEAGHPDPPFGSTCPLTWESWRAAHPSLATLGVQID